MNTKCEEQNTGKFSMGNIFVLQHIVKKYGTHYKEPIPEISKEWWITYMHNKGNNEEIRTAEA